MDRKEMRKVVKDFFKSKGFQSQNRYHYKKIDDDYLIAVDLFSAGFMKAYQIDFGAIFLPDEDKFPLTGRFDYYEICWFPEEPGDKLDLGDTPDCEFSRDNLTFYFKYEIYTPGQLEHYLEINYERFVVPMLDKNYILDYYRNHLRSLNALGEKTFIKMCIRAELDPKEVKEYVKCLEKQQLNPLDLFRSPIISTK